jgi:hypothetical protein
VRLSALFGGVQVSPTDADVKQALASKTPLVSAVNARACGRRRSTSMTCAASDKKAYQLKITAFNSTRSPTLARGTVQALDDHLMQKVHG